MRAGGHSRRHTGPNDRGDWYGTIAARVQRDGAPSGLDAIAFDVDVSSGYNHRSALASGHIGCQRPWYALYLHARAGGRPKKDDAPGPQEALANTSTTLREARGE
jgi:hypothetical protein